METWRDKDKSDWGDGPWQTEPDRMEWADGATGLPCMIIRNQSGALNGYVGLPKGHEYFNLGFNDEDFPWLRVHGGVTYAARVRPGCAGDVRCLTEGQWWLGFDCSHSGDYMPADVAASLPFASSRRYKDIEYVKRQVESLASQLITPIEALALVELGDG